MDLSRTWKDLMSRLLLGMFGTLIGLFILHRRQRDEDREKRVQYWREQVRPCSCLLAGDIF